MDCKQEYTIFTRFGFLDASNCGNAPLQEGIEYAVTIGCEPVAWAPESTDCYSGTENYQTLQAAALAAGRLIEKTPSGWVALGAEPKTPEQSFDDALARVRKVLFDQGNAAMILRDGLPQPKARHAPEAWTVTTSTAKPNPFQNYTAPDCNADPDHLNASRHQMAGMKG